LRQIGFIYRAGMVQRDSSSISDIPTNVIDIDIMNGEFDALGQGLGSNAISLVAEAALSDPAVPFVIACVWSGQSGLAAGIHQSGIPQGQGIRRCPQRAARAHGAPPP
jgi:hypothetical protein